MLLTLISIIVFPVLIGYLYGRNQIDPNTHKGRHYYAIAD